jgi:hypothetical protein
VSATTSSTITDIYFDQVDNFSATGLLLQEPVDSRYDDLRLREPSDARTVQGVVHQTIGN